MGCVAEMKSIKIALLFLTIFLLFINFSYGLMMPKEDLRVLLKNELDKYFKGQRTILTTEDIKILLDAYSSSQSSSYVQVDETRLTDSTRQMLELRYVENKTDSPAENKTPQEDNGPKLKPFDEYCTDDEECETGRCDSPPCFWIGCITKHKKRCLYQASERLKASNEYCKSDDECASKNCKKFCLWFCTHKCA
jgi:hypothetical protein